MMGARMPPLGWISALIVRRDVSASISLIEKVVVDCLMGPPAPETDMTMLCPCLMSAMVSSADPAGANSQCLVAPISKSFSLVE